KPAALGAARRTAGRRRLAEGARLLDRAAQSLRFRGLARAACAQGLPKAAGDAALGAGGHLPADLAETALSHRRAHLPRTAGLLPLPRQRSARGASLWPKALAALGQRPAASGPLPPAQQPPPV